MKTIDYGLHYERYYPPLLDGYCDVNWISDYEESKSTSNYVFTLGNVTVSWEYKKQTCISRSMMDSKIIGMALAGEEAE